MATQHVERNLLLNLYRGDISLVYFCLPFKRDKNVWHLQPLSSIWRPLAFLPVTLSLCCPVFLPSIFPSIKIFSNESTLHIRWPNYWSFSFSISLSKDYSGLISFRIDLFNLLAVQGTLKSLLQHQLKSINSLAFNLLYGPTLTSIHDHWKNCSFGRTLVGKVTPLLFNMLSRLIIAFLPRSKFLLISWLQSPPAVIFKPKKIKSVMVSIVSPSVCHVVMGLNAMILVFCMLSFKSAFSLSFLTFIKRLFSSSWFSAIRVVSSAYLRLLIFLLTMLIPACTSSSQAFCMMHSA